MGQVWYVRHGESESNVRGVFADGTDNQPLTQKGINQAKSAGKMLKGNKFTAIITSPLDRTVDTAINIAEQIGFPKDQIKKDDRLIEYLMASGNAQPYEGMTAEKIIAFEGAEDPGVFADRIRAALTDASKIEGNVLVVSHGGVGKLINCLSEGGDPKKFYDYPKTPNAEPFNLDLDWL